MNLDTASKVTRSGLEAHARRVTAHATNIANVETTRTPEGGPFRPLVVGLESKRVGDGGRGVRAVLEQSEQPALGRFDPAHPHADADGWVWLPAVDVTRETTSLAVARRAYEANLAAKKALGSMHRAALDLAR